MLSSYFYFLMTSTLFPVEFDKRNSEQRRRQEARGNLAFSGESVCLALSIDNHHLRHLTDSSVKHEHARNERENIWKHRIRYQWVTLANIDWTSTPTPPPRQRRPRQPMIFSSKSRKTMPREANVSEDSMPRKTMPRKTTPRKTMPRKANAS